MQFPRRAPPGSSYESQAARWKQGFKPGAAGGGARQTDLEGALVAELCSSIGSSSFPPREVLHKLLRYLHTLDHEYVCELLDDKLQNPLWQVQAKAVSVLDAIIKSGEAEFYKRYYFERLDTIEALCRARKDMLRARADKVYNVLKDYAPPPVKDAPERGFMHTSPVIESTQAPRTELMPGFDSPRSNSEPLPGPAHVPVSAFSFIAASTQEPDEAPEPSPLPSPAAAPSNDGSAFSFLNRGVTLPPTASPDTTGMAKAQAIATPTVVSASPPAATSAFAFIAASSSPAASPPTRPMAAPSAPSMSAVGVSGFSFLNPSAAHSPPSAPPQAPPVTAAPSPESASAFAFMAAAPAAATAPPIHAQQPRHDVFDTLPPPAPTAFGAALQQEPRAEEAAVEEEEPDPIHDAFEGLSMEPDAEHPLEGGAALRNTPVDFTPYREVETAVDRADVREVILEVEMPPGPMGIMLDRTITDMVVIERFIPLPSGDKGYLEMHPAICPGCALVSVNSIHVEDRGIDEVGPILGSLGQAPKLLRFKKLMFRGRTVNPSTLTMPYVPPPPMQEVVPDDFDDGEEETKSGDDASEGGEDYMDELNSYNDELAGIEKQLDALILKERNAIPVGDRRNALAQMHGHVERIQTQGIDSVIFGPNPPPNYEDVKRYRSSLVRKAEALAQRIHLTATSAPGAVPISREYSASPGVSVALGEHPPAAASVVSSVNDPPLGLSQLEDASSFQFMNARERNVETDRNSGSSYGFSFLRDSSAAEAQSSISQAPTSLNSSFGFMQNSAVSAGAPGPSVSPQDASASVFSGLTLREDTHARASETSDPLSESSHGRPMGIHDLSMSVSSLSGIGAFPRDASMAPSSTLTSPGTPGPSLDVTISAFGFLSTNGPSDTLTSSSSSADLASSPTAFDFLQANASSEPSTRLPPAMHDRVERAETGSVFSFISN